MGSLIRDLRFAVRSFGAAPRFTIPAVLALALGIGATSATFSVIRGVMLKPLPYRDPDRVVVVWENNHARQRSRNVIASANFVAWRERSRSFAHLGMAGSTRATMMLGGEPEEISGFAASADVFPALGVHPAIGRAYSPAEDEEGRDQVIVLGHDFWRTRFGGRSDVVGETVRVNGEPRTVVGVMPPGFTMLGQRADFLIPYGWTIERLRASPGRGFSHGVARLREGVPLEQATAEMVAIAAHLEKEFPRRNAGWSVTLVPVHEQMVDQVRPALRILAGAVGFVLLIACVNVANLLLARGTHRRRELGVRAALGAGRGRLVRQMLTETVLLAGAGGAAGLGLAALFHRGLLALVADRLPVPRIEQVALDVPVVAFTVTLAVAAGLLFGLAPALIASGMVAGALHDGGRHGPGPRSRRVLGSLVVAEVALSLVLLTGAGVLARSFARLQGIDPGFRAEGLFTARVLLPATRYEDDRRSAGFYTSALARIRTLPGVRDAAAVSFLPLAGLGIGTSFYRADGPMPADGEAPTTDVRPVTPRFFRTMGIPHVQGRDFGSADAVDSLPVAIVSETLVRQQFAGENPIGKRIHVSIGPPSGREYEIVGVVGDIKMTALEGDTRPAVYLPHTQLAIGMMTFVVRADLEPLSLVPGVGRAVREIDPELPLGEVRTMEEVVDATLARPRVTTVLLSAFALMALVLAAVGVYGVMAFSVSQRTQEIGVRMALGATERRVFRLVVGSALRLVALGVAAGVALAVALSRSLETLLYETTPLDPWTFAVTTAVLVAVAVLASYVPARRGMHVAPVEALRAE